MGRERNDMGRMLLVVFLAVPLIEIALFVAIGQAVGVVPTLLGVLATAIIGSAIVRVQGGGVIEQIRRTLGRGQLPARSMADGLLIGLAGLLLVLPGYFTDAIGFLLLIPPVRAALYGLLLRHVGVVAPGAPMGPARNRVGGDTTIDLDEAEWRKR